VNGVYSGSKADKLARQMVVQVPANERTPARIEVFAVEPEDVYEDFSFEQELSGFRGRVKLKMIRSQSLELGSKVEIFCDSGIGDLVYNDSCRVCSFDVWSGFTVKAGYGLSKFGMDDFGFEWSAGAGFGASDFGCGEHGIDGDIVEWVSEPLEKGVYKFGVRVVGKMGVVSSVDETEVKVFPGACGAESLEVEHYDKYASELILRIN